MFRIRTGASDRRSLNPGEIPSIVLATETFVNRQRKRNDDSSNYRRRCYSASNTPSEDPKTRPQEYRECAQGRIRSWQVMTMETVSTNRTQEYHRQSISGLGFSTTSFRDRSISIRFCPVNCLGSDQIFIG